jgi:hypothetical protein
LLAPVSLMRPLRTTLFGLVSRLVTQCVYMCPLVLALIWFGKPLDSVQINSAMANHS